MKCSKCGSRWESSIKSSNCPFCGEVLSTHNNFDNISETLRFIVESHGIEVYKTPKLLIAYISDYAPNLNSELRLIKMCVPAGIIEKIADNINLSIDDRELFIEKAFSNLCTDYFINENAARNLLDWLTYSVGWSCSSKHLIMQEDTGHAYEINEICEGIHKNINLLPAKKQ